MEQRIGSSSQPLDGAGVDPAFIPGLTSPVSVEQKDSVEPDDSVQPDDSVEPDDAVPDEEAAAGGPQEPEEPEQEPAAEESPAEAQEAPDGPVFEAADRRARIVADHSGVRLRLDDQECEFGWDEIGAVETETARFGKRFTVTVHTTERRWYPIEIEADSRARFKEWEARLDEVLDAYFEDGEEESAAPEKDDD
ncbi:hypothetical protein ACFYZJ_17080 [Streptomyces sp. NPDC001848]|uniref:hypothetical protein n=1 Tax=Streptomyces sp. NPDC001848 TaxID=3364618 RepID=UPI00368B4989